MKKLIGIMLAFLICAAASFPALAGVGRSAEEWAKLEDNTLEYQEIEDLIREYNPAVKKNDLELSDFRKNYGVRNQEVRDAYQELADALYNAVDPGSITDPQYGMLAALAIGNETQAKQFETMADSTTDDYETYRLSYELAEKTLAQSAKANMIDYYANELSLQQAALSVQMQQETLRIKTLQHQLGLITEAEVLAAQEALLSAQQALTAAQTQLPLIKKKLQVLCGWGYESDPVLGALPEPDLSRIQTMNPAEDTGKALESNYTLKINERKLRNASSDSTKKTLEATVVSNRQNIASSVNTAYANVLAAQDAYQYAVSNASLQQTNLENLRRKFSSGAASRFEVQCQEIQTQIAELQIRQEAYSLQNAILSYDAAVNGLAGA